ncbi:MAG TPA: hypothetical protein VGY55_06325 [Pirellulales bacterium]|jgi:FtsH-binding integral membrane protein|nr:hypothetical protein [Pirellulales bacterium]
MSKPIQFSMRRTFAATAVFCVGAWELAMLDKRDDPDFVLGYLLWVAIFAIIGGVLGIVVAARPIVGALCGMAVWIWLAGIGILAHGITSDHARFFP